MRLVPTTTLDGVTPITQVITTGTLSSGSPVITGIAATSAILGALAVSGVGIPAYTYVQSIDSPTQCTLTQAVTANGPQSLTFTLEPVTLAEAKAQARDELPATDPAAPLDNALIASFIMAARRPAEVWLKSALLTQSWTLYLDSFPSAGGYYNRAIREIWPSLGGLPSGLGFYPGLVPNSTGVIDIPVPPLQSITAVQYYNFAGVLTTVASSAYNVSLGTPARIQPQYSTVWPISRPTIDSVQITFTAGYGPTAAVIPENIKTFIRMAVSHWYENRDLVAESGMAHVPFALEALLGPSDPGLYA